MSYLKLTLIDHTKMSIVYDGSNDPFCINSYAIIEDNSRYYMSKFGKDLYRTYLCLETYIVFPRFIFLCDRWETVVIIVKATQSFNHIKVNYMQKQCFIEYGDYIYVFGRNTMQKISLNYDIPNESIKRSFFVVNHNNIISMLAKYVPNYNPNKIHNKHYFGFNFTGIQKNMAPLKIVSKLYDIVVYCNC